MDNATKEEFPDLGQGLTPKAKRKKQTQKNSGRFTLYISMPLSSGSSKENYLAPYKAVFSKSYPLIRANICGPPYKDCYTVNWGVLIYL